MSEAIVSGPTQASVGPVTVSPGPSAGVAIEGSGAPEGGIEMEAG